MRLSRASTGAATDSTGDAERHAARLAQATDALDQSLTRAETALAELGLGVRAEVILEESQDEHTPIAHYRALVFGKLDKHWRLTFETYWDDPDSPCTVTPLLNASREIRLGAARHLPELHAAMLREAERQISSVEDATSAVAALVTSLATGWRSP